MPVAKKHLAVIFAFVLTCIFLFSQSPLVWALAKKPLHNETHSLTTQVIPLTYSLLDCYRFALKRSETIAIKKEDIEETEAQFLKATGELFGDVDFLITDFRQDALDSPTSTGDSVGRTSTARDRRERKFVITQPIFQGFRSIAALGAAGSLKNQRKQEWTRAEELLFIDVASAFYRVLKQQKELEIVQGIRQALSERFGELTEREKIGRSRPSEVASADSKLKMTDSELARSQAALAIAIHVLEFLTGNSIKPTELNDRDLPKYEKSDLDDYLDSSEYRSDVEASRYATKTAWQGVVEAQSKLWPEVSLDSNIYEKREGFQKDINWDVLFKINIPLSRGGENLGNLKEAISRWKKSKLSYSLTKRQVSLDIEETYENWHASLEDSKALEEAVRASQKNFDLQKDEYTKNLVSNLDVLQALEELHNTKRKANQSYYQMKENFWRLQVATGHIHEFI